MASIDRYQNMPFMPGERMIVFVPGSLKNLAEFARQVHAQAAAQKRKVLYLALTSRGTDHFTDARQLATITALTQDSTVQASAVQMNGDDRADMLRQVTHPGDIVVWPNEGLRAPTSLEESLGITQQVLPGVHASAAFRAVPWWQAALIWLALLLILGGFTWLEIYLTGAMRGAALKAALIGAFSLELAAVSLWNRISG